MRPSRCRRTGGARLCLALLILALASAWPAAPSARAQPEGCPGSGPGPCPYKSAQIIGQRAEGVLRFPEAIALESTITAGGGNVYVADQLSYVVQKFSASGTFETEWGSYGAGQGQFGPIGGLATDSSGDVYVVDSSHDRIEKFDSEGAFITEWGGAGSGLGQFNFHSSQNPSQPPGGGIAVAGDYVFVSDTGNNRIERFNLEGGEAIQWGSYGSGPGQFSYPRGLAANASEVLVSDDDNHRIEKFSLAGEFQGAVGSAGKGPGEFGTPYGVALDAAGNVYVADDINDRVVKLTPQLSFATAWGGSGSKPGQLVFPRALASDPAGDTYVADTANDRVEVFDSSGDYLRTLGVSAGVLGALTAPQGLASDPAGGLLVSDTIGNRIERFAPGSDSFAGVWTTAGGRATGFSRPAGIGIDPRGAVYVADQGYERVVRLWGDGTFLSELGGPGELGGAQLNGVSSVAVAPGSGDAYVADAGHNRVLVYGPDGSLLETWGSGGGDGAAGSGVGEFNHPTAIAIASGGEGNVYVADEGNDRVVELSPGGNVLAQWGSKGDGDGQFDAPTGIAVDGAGNVYVADSVNNRIQVFGSAGQFLEKWGIAGIFLGEFAQPSAVAVDCAGNVYVADTDNNRVERFAPVSPVATGCLAPGAWPPPLDVPPVLHLSLVRRAGVLARRALALSISCQRGCKVLVTATLSPRGRRPAIDLIAASRRLPPALAGYVRLRVGPLALRRLRKALGPRGAMTAHVRVIAAGPTGRRTTLTRAYGVSV